MLLAYSDSVHKACRVYCGLPKDAALMTGQIFTQHENHTWGKDQGYSEELTYIYMTIPNMNHRSAWNLYCSPKGITLE